LELFPANTHPTKRAPAKWFTGEVWQDPVITAPSPANLRALIVTFAPGARTNWHTHPVGQTLHILRGHGLICKRGGTPQPVAAGDTVWFAPGEEHWHGASPDQMMVHLAMQEADANGEQAHWLDAVTDAEYSGA
jgi:quercetin dioxygenase-like cupin family protein